MNDILDDLNSWQALLVVERRYRQQVGEEPGVDLDFVTRAIDEITCLRTTLAETDAPHWQRQTQAPEPEEGQ